MRRIRTLLPLLLVACAQEPPVCKLFKDAIHEHAVALVEWELRDGAWADVIATREAAEEANLLRLNVDSAQTCACVHWEVAEMAWMNKAMDHEAEELLPGNFQTIAFMRALKAGTECAPERHNKWLREKEERADSAGKG
jgi:hypothetical protein